MGVPEIITDSETGEMWYLHPFTREKIYLEPEDEPEDVADGWEQHFADMADDARKEADL